KEIKKKRFFISVPFKVAKFQSYFFQMMPRPLLTVDQVELLKYDNIVSENFFKLKDFGIPTAIYYPKPLHLQEAFSNLNYSKGYFPVSESIAQRIFSLPMHPYLTDEDINKICEILIFCKELAE
ncbi:MAG TPA: hypothetical protein EYQ06_09445, partial [Flavobacteriales bacterium]|nr:hypothetical protein [Flavobacteriales bacterium]